MGTKEVFAAMYILGAIGIVLSLLTIPSSMESTIEGALTILPDMMPVGVIGAIGYALIVFKAAVAYHNYKRWWTWRLLNHILIAFAAGFTAYLMWQAFQIKLACAPCVATWALNIILFIITVIHVLRSRRNNGVA